MSALAAYTQDAFARREALEAAEQARRRGIGKAIGKGLASIAGVAATPFTGGASLAAPILIGAAPGLIGAGVSAATGDRQGIGRELLDAGIGGITGGLGRLQPSAPTEVPTEVPEIGSQYMTRLRVSNPQAVQPFGRLSLLR